MSAERRVRYWARAEFQSVAMHWGRPNAVLGAWKFSIENYHQISEAWTPWRGGTEVGRRHYTSLALHHFSFICYMQFSGDLPISWEGGGSSSWIWKLLVSIVACHIVTWWRINVPVSVLKNKSFEYWFDVYYIGRFLWVRVGLTHTSIFVSLSDSDKFFFFLSLVYNAIMCFLWVEADVLPNYVLLIFVT